MNMIGAWTYLAAWDTRRAKIFGRLEEKNGIGPFDRLVSQVMSQEPYVSAERVFWIEVAKPFEWKFTRADLKRLCTRLSYNEQVKKRELVAACC